MLLYTLWAVLLMIATEPKQRTTSHPAGVFLAVFYQEPTAGTLANCPGWLHAVQIHFDAPEGVLSAFYASTGNLSLLIFQALYAPIERARKAYITAVTIQEKGRNNSFRPQKQQTAQDQGKFLYQFSVISYHFSGVKNLWGVCLFFKNRKSSKSLTGVIFKRKFFKKFFKKNLPGVCPKTH